MKWNNLSRKFTTFVSESLPDMRLELQVGSWPNVLHRWQSRNLGRQNKPLCNEQLSEIQQFSLYDIRMCKQEFYLNEY